METLKQITALLHACPADEKAKLCSAVKRVIIKIENKTGAVKLPPNMTYDSRCGAYYYVKRCGKHVHKRQIGRTRAEADEWYENIKTQVKTAKYTNKPIAEIDAFKKPSTDGSTLFSAAAKKAGIAFCNTRGGTHIEKYFSKIPLSSITEDKVKQFIRILLDNDLSNRTIRDYLLSLGKVLRKMIKGTPLINAVREMQESLPSACAFKVLWTGENEILTAAAKRRDERTAIASKKKRKSNYLTLTERAEIAAFAAQWTPKANRFEQRHCPAELELFVWLLNCTCKRLEDNRAITFSINDKGNYVDFENNQIIYNAHKTAHLAGSIKKPMHPILRQLLLDKFEIQKAKYAGKDIIPVFDMLPKHRGGMSAIMRRLFDAMGGHWKNRKPYGSIKSSILTDCTNNSGRLKDAADAGDVSVSVMSKHYLENTGAKNSPLLKLNYQRIAPQSHHTETEPNHNPLNSKRMSI